MDLNLAKGKPDLPKSYPNPSSVVPGFCLYPLVLPSLVLYSSIIFYMIEIECSNGQRLIR